MLVICVSWLAYTDAIICPTQCLLVSNVVCNLQTYSSWRSSFTSSSTCSNCCWNYGGDSGNMRSSNNFVTGRSSWRPTLVHFVVHSCGCYMKPELVGVAQGGIGPAGLSTDDLHVLDLTQAKPRWHRWVYWSFILFQDRCIWHDRTRVVVQVIGMLIRQQTQSLHVNLLHPVDV